MTLQEADTKLSLINEEIARLLKEREKLQKEWITAFNSENPENIVCIDENIEDIVHNLYLVNGNFKMHVCLFDCYDMKKSVNDFYKRIDISMQMFNAANGRKLDSPDCQKNLVYAKAAEIREKYLAKAACGEE